MRSRSVRPREAGTLAAGRMIGVPRRVVRPRSGGAEARDADMPSAPDSAASLALRCCQRPLAGMPARAEQAVAGRTSLGFSS